MLIPDQEVRAVGIFRGEDRRFAEQLADEGLGIEVAALARGEDAQHRLAVIRARRAQAPRSAASGLRESRGYFSGK